MRALILHNTLRLKGKYYVNTLIMTIRYPNQKCTTLKSKFCPQQLSLVECDLLIYTVIIIECLRLFRRSYLVPTHVVPTNLVPTHFVTTYCQLLLQFTLKLLKIETSFF